MTERANWIKTTHNGTGGTGTLTLAAQTGWPEFTDAFGATLTTQIVDYAIKEYTSSTKLQLSKAEKGIGILNLTTKVLTRSIVTASWDAAGPTYLPKVGSATAPTAINFGNTAVNIDIDCGPANETLIPRGISTKLSSIYHSGAGSDGSPPGNIRLVATATNTTTQFCLYMPVLIQNAKPISVATAYCFASSVGGVALKVGIYDYDLTTGKPKNLLADFGTLGNMQTVGRLASGALATPVYLNGWHIMGYLFNYSSGSPTVVHAELTDPGPFGGTWDAALYGMASSLFEGPGITTMPTAPNPTSCNATQPLLPLVLFS